MPKKNLFQSIKEMNAADTADNCVKPRVVLSYEMTQAQLTKKGVVISMGVAGDAKLIFDLESRKKVAVLMLLDMDEYKKFSEE